MEAGTNFEPLFDVDWSIIFQLDCGKGANKAHMRSLISLPCSHKEIWKIRVASSFGVYFAVLAIFEPLLFQEVK